MKLKRLFSILSFMDQRHLFVPLILATIFFGLLFSEWFFGMDIVSYNLSIARYNFSEIVLDRPSLLREEFFSLFSNDRVAGEIFSAIRSDFEVDYSECGGEVFLNSSKINCYLLESSHISPYLAFLKSNSDEDLCDLCDSLVLLYSPISHSDSEATKAFFEFFLLESKWKISTGFERELLRKELVEKARDLYDKTYLMPSLFSRMRFYSKISSRGKYLGEFHIHLNGGGPSESDLVKFGTQFLFSFLGNDSCEVYEYRKGKVIAKMTLVIS